MEILLIVVKYGLLGVLAVEAALVGRALWQVVTRREASAATQE